MLNQAERVRPDNSLPGRGVDRVDNELPDTEESSPKHGGGSEEDVELPGDLVAGTTVIYHLRRSWGSGDYPHRVGIVSGIRDAGHGPRRRVAVDLTVFMQPGDGDHRDTMLAIADAKYDPECPAGTFCLVTDGEDELMTVANWQALIDKEEQERKDRLKKKIVKDRLDDEAEPKDDSEPTPDKPDGKSDSATKGKSKKPSGDAAADFRAQVEGPELTGTERKAAVTGKTVGEVRAETPRFDKPAEK